MSGRRWAGALAALVATLALRGCGGGIVNTSYTGLLQGTVTYECREPDPMAPDQLMEAPVVRPATGRPLLVAMASGSGVAFSRTLTDAWGRYAVMVPEGVTLTVSCLAARKPSDRADGAGFDVIDPGADFDSLGDDLTWNVSGQVTVATSATLDLLAPLASQGGAFAIAQALDRGFATAAAYGLSSASQPLPAPRIYWRPGLDSFLATPTSFYLLTEVFPLFFIRSFAASSPSVSLADEWNPGTVLHEFGHFVISHRSKDDSPGGAHSGLDEDPRLALGEGLAHFFSSLSTGDEAVRAWYGYGASGGYELDFDLSDLTAWPLAYSGLYSELSVASMLLAAHDGAGTSPPDVVADPLDGRGATVASILRSLAWLRDHPFSTFLDFADEWSRVSPGDFGSLVAIMASQNIVWNWADPLATWPTPLAAPASETGFCSSVGNYPNGLAVSRFYRIELTGAATINVTLTMTSGTGAAPGNLDLRLLDSFGRVVAKSESTSSLVETVSYAAAAGQYLVQVRAPMEGAATNTAFFSLSYSN